MTEHAPRSEGPWEPLEYLAGRYSTGKVSTAVTHAAPITRPARFRLACGRIVLEDFMADRGSVGGGLEKVTCGGCIQRLAREKKA